MTLLIDLQKDHIRNIWRRSTKMF